MRNPAATARYRSQCRTERSLICHRKVPFRQTLPHRKNCRTENVQRTAVFLVRPATAFSPRSGRTAQCHLEGVLGVPRWCPGSVDACCVNVFNFFNIIYFHLLQHSNASGIRVKIKRIPHCFKHVQKAVSETVASVARSFDSEVVSSPTHARRKVSSSFVLLGSLMQLSC